jgi:hypothetical protein
MPFSRHDSKYDTSKDSRAQWKNRRRYSFRQCYGIRLRSGKALTNLASYSLTAFEIYLCIKWFWQFLVWLVTRYNIWENYLWTQQKFKGLNCGADSGEISDERQQIKRAGNISRPLNLYCIAISVFGDNRRPSPSTNLLVGRFNTYCTVCFGERLHVRDQSEYLRAPGR